MNLATFLSTPIGELLRTKRTDIRQRDARKPGIGATVCCAGLRLTVQAGLSDELWSWLVAMGWRELGPGENRLHFKPLPSGLVARLFDAEGDERQRIMIAAIRQVTRPTPADRPLERVPSA